jgi:hypothetical protein
MENCLDIGVHHSDLRAAATDALKKAATLLGVGLHLYSEEAAPQPVNGQVRAGQPGYFRHLGQSSHNSHQSPVNGYHDPGHPQGAHYQNHVSISIQN